MTEKELIKKLNDEFKVEGIEFGIFDFGTIDGRQYKSYMEKTIELRSGFIECDPSDNEVDEDIFDLIKDVKYQELEYKKVLQISNFLKERLPKTEFTIEEDISRINGAEQYYIPDVYKNCELVIYRDDLISNCIFIKSKNSFETFVLAPRRDIEYPWEFLKDFTDLHINLNYGRGLDKS